MPAGPLVGGSELGRECACAGIGHAAPRSDRPVGLEHLEVDAGAHGVVVTELAAAHAVALLELPEQEAMVKPNNRRTRRPMTERGGT